MTTGYSAHQPDRSDIDALEGPALLVFGADWCGYCRNAEAALAAALSEFPELPVIKAEDGRGRPLGRSYTVKLWPTMIFLRDGAEVARLVRPTGPGQIAEALATITQ